MAIAIAGFDLDMKNPVWSGDWSFVQVKRLHY